MFLVMIDDNGNKISFMQTAFGTEEAVRLNDDGSVTFPSHALVEVRSERPAEAVDVGTDKQLGFGTWFNIAIVPDTTVRFRQCTTDRVFGRAEIDDDRAMCTVTVCSHERPDNGQFDFGSSWEDGSLSRVIASLAAIQASIPEQYRDSARCEISSESGYEGSHYPSIEVSYTRPETDDEVVRRLTDAAVENDHKERMLRCQYDALRAKFEAQ